MFFANEDLEITPIKVEYKGHHNSRSQRLDQATYDGAHRVINDDSCPIGVSADSCPAGAP